MLLKKSPAGNRRGIDMMQGPILKNLLLFSGDVGDEVGKLRVSELIRKVVANRFDLFGVAERILDVKKFFGRHKNSSLIVVLLFFTKKKKSIRSKFVDIIICLIYN